MKIIILITPNGISLLCEQILVSFGAANIVKRHGCPCAVPRNRQFDLKSFGRERYEIEFPGRNETFTNKGGVGHGALHKGRFHKLIQRIYREDNFNSDFHYFHPRE